jgi:uncharacterized membrane protein
VSIADSGGLEVAGTFADRWVWITIFSALLVMVVPLMVVWVILNLPAELKVVATIGIIVLWGVVSGYKDWVVSKRQEEERKAPHSPA